MEIRSGSPSDAEAIARLIASFQSDLTDDPSGAGAEAYLASVSAQAEREYLTSPRYRYLLAYAGSSARRVHRYPRRFPPISPVRRACTPTPRPRSRLVGGALHELGPPGSQGAFTVNSSLAAVPVYRALGFLPAESIRSAHGISFLPMRRPGSLV